MVRLSPAEIKAALSDDRLGGKMHLLEGYDGDRVDDLEQLKKDVYENFTSISKLFIAYLYAQGFGEDVMGIIGLNITFKLVLKLCAGKKRWREGKKLVINSSCVDILKDLEIFLCYNAKHGYMDHDDVDHDHMHQKLLEMLSNTTLPCCPCTSSFIIDEVDSVLELATSNNSNVEELPESDRCSIKFLQFSKDYCLMINNDNHENLPELFRCVESVFHVIIKKCWDPFHSTREDLDICKAIFKVLIMLVESDISTPALADELLIGYVNCIQLILMGLLTDEGINILMDPTKKDQLMILNENLISLVPLLNYYEQEKLLDHDDRIHLQAMSCNLGSLIYLVFNNGNMETETNLLQLHGLIEKVSATKTQFERIFVIILKKLIQASPHTDQLGFLNFLIENIKEQISCNLVSIFFGKVQFLEIHKDLVFFKSFLEKVTPCSMTDDASQALCTRIRYATYMVKYIIDSFIVGAFPVTYQSTLTSAIAQEIKLINEECDTLIPISDSGKNNIDVSPKLVTIATDPVQTVDMVIGLEDETDKIMDRLTSNSKERELLSVTGMPGLGKTTLVRKVYEHPYIVNHFEYRAWCCVSQKYHKREVLLTILGCVVLLIDEIRTKSAEDLSVMLHKELIGRRYLIVMDDVWVMEVFEEIQLFFPDCDNGSRLILTSRDKLVGSLAEYHLELRQLTKKESWALLEHKVYQKEKCPLELCQVGKEIANECRGLPLAIVVVAGLLFTSNDNLDFWEQVAGNLQEALESQKYGMSALDLSYEFLPEHLKPLFLHLGAFPEDKVIAAETLKWLWVAEGFVHNTDGEISLEDKAESFLMELIYRNLLIVAKKRYDGRIIRVKIHDLLREMSIRKAEEEMFLHHIHVPSGGVSLPDPFYSFYRVCTSLSKNGTPIRSLVTYDDLERLLMPPPLHSHLCFTNNHKKIDWSQERCRNFKLLRVLHFEIFTQNVNLLSDTIHLVRLRYISIKTCESKIPSSISSLINLEILIVSQEGYTGEISVPVEIWKMVKLRHIHLTPMAYFVDALKDFSKLENLQTLSKMVFHYGEEENLIRRMPNIRELKFDLRSDPIQYPQLESLNQLELLELFNSYDLKLKGELSLPSTLKELTLYRFHLQWNQISSFHNLPNLGFLKLCNGSVDGEFWELEDDDVFPKLEVIKFEFLEIKQWIAGADNFPCLKKLSIKRCWQLEEIPSDIGEIESLTGIYIQYCNDSINSSAREIQEHQKYFGNDSLIVCIDRRRSVE